MYHTYTYVRRKILSIVCLSQDRVYNKIRNISYLRAKQDNRINRYFGQRKKNCLRNKKPKLRRALLKKKNMAYEITLKCQKMLSFTLECELPHLT